MSESQGKILHVDDNEANRYVVTRILQKAGFTVVEAATGAAGLKAIAEHQPALVILDVKLPDLSGFEVCHQIKANPKTTFLPVLHLSASFVQSQDKAEGLDGGADGYLVQPVEPIELIATVRSLLRIRRAEALALTSAQEWQTTFDSINDSVCLLDREGKVLRCNQAMRQLFCKPFQDILGYAHHELMQIVLGVGDGTCFRLAKETHQHQVLELQANGRWFAKTMDPVLNDQGLFTGAVFILSDITGRKQAEADLSEGEQQLKLALKTGRLGSWQLNFKSMELIMSEQCKENFGLAPTAEFSHQHLREMIHPEDRAWVQSAYDTAILTQTDYDVEYRTVWLDGSAHWILVRGQCFYDAVGTPTRMVGISMDITERKQAEDEREQLLAREQVAREQAEMANRIKDEFLAVLSHELRSPLNPILGWTQLLQAGDLDLPQQALALKTIERNASLQAQLIEDLLDISRIMQGKLVLTAAPVSLTSVISAALETVRLAAAAKNIQILLDFSPIVSPIFGDATRLQQVVWNLLTNAVKFTPPEGQVTVKLRQIERLAQIRVSDTGKGIEPQFLPHIFEYFRQADSSTTRKFGGLGLGLAIVRQIVEMHGGTVKAESLGEDRGAIFTVHLPVLQQSVPAIADPVQAKVEKKQNTLRNLQILVVDDNADTREFQAFLLKQNGAKVVAVASGLEALQSLDRSVPDVLVSDVGMADMDGYMLMRQIRSRPSRQGGAIRAIAVTAYATDLDRQKALRSGFQGHITKPVEPEILIKAIVNLLDG